MKKSKKTAVALISIGLLLIMSAFLLWGFNELMSYRAAQETAEILSNLENQMLDEISVTAEAEEGTMPTRISDGIDIVGVVSVPSLEIEVPVAAEWSYENLRKSACRYSGTVEDGRLIILAHNYSRHFGNLKNAAVGDEVQFMDVNGKLYLYSVTEMELLNKNELDKLTESDSDLTLFTCTYGGQKRIVVRCMKQL
ncbi:MAG: sortase [Clostridia bacterium]|nr:sortase [Clostridia bacterium]